MSEQAQRQDEELKNQGDALQSVLDSGKTEQKPDAEPTETQTGSTEKE